MTLLQFFALCEAVLIGILGAAVCILYNILNEKDELIENQHELILKLEKVFKELDKAINETDAKK